MFDLKSQSFVLVHGLIFAELLLADESNRAMLGAEPLQRRS